MHNQKKLGPQGYNFDEVYDALQINSKCHKSTIYKSKSFHTKIKDHDSISFEGVSIYVDPNSGKDTNPGTFILPFQTIHAAILEARKSDPSTIFLRKGVYYLTRTLILNSMDNNLSIKNYKDENVIISGAKPLNLVWKPYNLNRTNNIWMTDIINLDDIPGLRLDGQRVVRARHPNGNPEHTGLHTNPTGWIAKAQSWLSRDPPKQKPIEVKVSTPNRLSEIKEFPFYTNGIGGVCNGMFVPNVSFWCNPHNPRDGAGGVWNAPRGMVYLPEDLGTKKWTNWSHGIVHTWHDGGHWASQMYKMDGYYPHNHTITWKVGGFQDARAGPNCSEYYIENVFDVLDSPNEYYYSPEQKRLYVYYNGTGQPKGQFVATHLQTLISFEGTQQNPVRNVSIKGVMFRDTAQTFFEPHGVPSCGDWALQRMAGIFIEGTEYTHIDSCIFERMDGNALMLSKYNRNVTISNNEFAWIGDTAMAAWGWTDELSDQGIHGYDATSGDFPRYTYILNNVVREVGLFEKQSSAWFQAKTAETTIRNNIFFNGPRAGINFNDGFGGGNDIDGNLIFNYCRESSDHGPFNSWDRQMFLVRHPDGGLPTVIPKNNTIRNNFIIGNYNTQEPIDNDDGSGWYNTYNNVLLYGRYGLKADLGGHDNWQHHNLYAYVFPVCQVDLGGGECLPTHRNGFHNNTCIQGKDYNSYVSFRCNSLDTSPVFFGNNIYNPSGKTNVCDIPLTDWQQKGHDPGTMVHKGIPSDDVILSWAAELLKMK